MNKIIRVSSAWSEYYSNGNPLLESESLPKIDFDAGDLLDLIDEDGEFLAKAYYGPQNKGCGWILSNKETDIDMNFFIRKFSAALTRRGPYFGSEETTAFRIFNGEGDGIGGITIDWFDGYGVINWYNEGIYFFRDEILKAIQSVMYFNGIYEKRRFDKSGKYIEEKSFSCGVEAPSPLVILENNIHYATYLDDGAMVGIFLDQKEVRKKIKEISYEGMNCLNLFSYTGAFSVAAASSGAMTTSVDLANRSLEKTKENFLINNIDLSRQSIVVSDVFDYFDEAASRGESYDLVVLDPPSYANSKKRRFSVQKDYRELVEKSAKLTKNGGILVASTNCSAMSIGKFKKQIREGLENQNRNYEILEVYRLPSDFVSNEMMKGSNYLKVVFVKMKG
jgi:23S rRNA (cytosine1962-C5)-methyltransferase